MFNVQRAIFQLYSGREHVYNKSICRLKMGNGWANKHLNATGLETRKGDGRDGEFSQCNRSPMDHCYTGFFNVRRGWQSLNTGPQFYLHLIRRTGWLWIYTSRTTDGRPFKPKKLSDLMTWCHYNIIWENSDLKLITYKDQRENVQIFGKR